MAYSEDDLRRDLEPYVKYYREFNIRNAALEFYQERLKGMP